MYYSQFGEDRLLARIFGGKRQGVCVEVGANNGIDGSNSLFFEDLGWDCVLVEPNPDLGATLKSIRKARVFLCAASSSAGTATLQIATGRDLAHAVSAIGDLAEARRMQRHHGVETRSVKVETRRLDDILAEAGLEPPIDFVSIDVEGHELDVLKGFSTDRWRPTVLIIEDNSVVWESVVRSHLGQLGYVRFRRTGVNDWYAHLSNKRLGNMANRVTYFPTMVAARIGMIGLRWVDWTVRQLERYPAGARGIQLLRSVRNRNDPRRLRSQRALEDSLGGSAEPRV